MSPECVFWPTNFKKPGLKKSWAELRDVILDQQSLQNCSTNFGRLGRYFLLKNERNLGTKAEIVIIKGAHYQVFVRAKKVDRLTLQLALHISVFTPGLCLYLWQKRIARKLLYFLAKTRKAYVIGRLVVTLGRWYREVGNMSSISIYIIEQRDIRTRPRGVNLGRKGFSGSFDSWRNQNAIKNRMSFASKSLFVEIEAGPASQQH